MVPAVKLNGLHAKIFFLSHATNQNNLLSYNSINLH